MATSSDQNDIRITVLISGNGSNLQALIDACKTPQLPSTQIVRVVSNRKEAYGLLRAQSAGISTTYHNLVRYKKQQSTSEEGVQIARRVYDLDLAKIILNDSPHLVVCAGWMHILSAAFVETLQNVMVPIINLHPALPGHFSGADAIHRAYLAFQAGEIKHTGVMIHKVINEVDMGEPVVTREVPLTQGESEEDVEKKIHNVEWELIIEGTAKTIESIRARSGA